MGEEEEPAAGTSGRGAAAEDAALRAGKRERSAAPKELSERKIARMKEKAARRGVVYLSRLPPHLVRRRPPPSAFPPPPSRRRLALPTAQPLTQTPYSRARRSPRSCATCSPSTPSSAASTSRPRTRSGGAAARARAATRA
jgi:hypothetical protein